MKKAFAVFLVLSILAVAGAWAYMRFLGGEIPCVSDYIGSRADQSGTPEVTASEEESHSADVVQTVWTATVHKDVVKVPWVLYGKVVPGKGALVTASAPYECQVRRILVREGQEVARGEPLMEITPSEDSRLALDQAQNLHDTARQELDRVKQRLAMKLATNEELIQATEAFRQAELQLKSLSRKGMNKSLDIKTDTAGVVQAINVHEGALVALGTALVEVAALQNVEACLGAEPDRVAALAEGQTLDISSLGKISGPKASCPIRGIAHTVSPTSHLVDVFVTLPKDTALLLGAPVKGEISVLSQETLVVPRSAVLPEEDHYIVFGIRNGHAHKIVVELGMENDQDAEVRSAALDEGDSVAILGNYELEDGMAVKTDDRP